MTQSSNNQTVTVRGGGSMVWLFIVLLVLKVNPGSYLDSPVENLSWLWVTAPLWGGLAIILAILAIAGLALGIAEFLDRRDAKRRRKAREERLANSTGPNRIGNNNRF